MNLLHPLLLSRVGDVLDQAGIAHGELVEGPAHLNLNASDSSRVFVKVTRAGDSHARAHAEVTSARWARTHRIACPEPLLDAPVAVPDENDTLRAVTVWAWTEPVGCPSLRDRAADVLDVIAILCEVPAPPDAAPFDVDFYLARLTDRLAGRTDETAQRLLATGHDTAARVKTLAATRPTGWRHADLHLDNVGWCLRGTPVIYDWESAALGPVEIDVAQLLRSILVNTPNHAPAERADVYARTVADAEARLDVDRDLIDALVAFRSASAASHLLFHGHGHDPRLLAANLTLLANLPH